MIEVSLLLHTGCTESYLFNWNELVLFVLNGHSWHFSVQTECYNTLLWSLNSYRNCVWWLYYLKKKTLAAWQKVKDPYMFIKCALPIYFVQFPCMHTDVLSNASMQDFSTPSSLHAYLPHFQRNFSCTACFLAHSLNNPRFKSPYFSSPVHLKHNAKFPCWYRT